MAHDDPAANLRDGNGTKERRDDTGPEGSSSGDRVADPLRDERGGIQKLNKRQKKALRDQTRALDSWERYRALTDVVDEQLELVDLADHKARFALMIMGALNAFLFIIASNTDAFDAIPDKYRPVAAAFVGLYAVMAIYFFVQAIESLRPRKSQASVGPIPGAARQQDAPMGLRFYDDMLSRDPTAYRQAWQDVNMSQLTGELAVQAHALAAINRPKYAALGRLYTGLKIMTVVSAVILLLGATFVLTGKEDRSKTKKAKGKGALLGDLLGGTKHEAESVLGEPEVVATDIREPSGMAFDLKLGHAFVVGDSGSVAEVDGQGKTLWRDKVKGDLEEVTVHTPTGLLVLLDEKKAELIFWDPSKRTERSRWQLRVAELLGESPTAVGQGFEGLTFKEDSSRPGGGIFYLAHQRSPTTVVGIAFDPTKPPTAKLGTDAVVSRFKLADVKELNALSWVPALDRLLALDDKQDEILVLSAEGGIERRVPVLGEQQEGMAIDPQGDLWLADDREGILRFRGALQKLKELATQPPATNAPAAAAPEDQADASGGKKHKKKPPSE